MSSSDGMERFVGVMRCGSSLHRLMIRRSRLRNIASAKVGMTSFPSVSKAAASPRISIPRAFHRKIISSPQRYLFVLRAREACPRNVVRLCCERALLQGAPLGDGAAS
jgi:hypothetical protein